MSTNPFDFDATADEPLPDVVQRPRSVPRPKPARTRLRAWLIIGAFVLVGILILSTLGGRSVRKLDDLEDTVSRYGQADVDMRLETLFDRPCRVLIYQRQRVQFLFRDSSKGWECFLIQDSVTKRDLAEREARSRFR